MIKLHQQESVPVSHLALDKPSTAQSQGQLNGRAVQMHTEAAMPSFAQRIQHHHNFHIYQPAPPLLPKRAVSVSPPPRPEKPQALSIGGNAQQRLSVQETSATQNKSSTNNLHAQAFAIWGNQVQVLESKPSRAEAHQAEQPLIWNSQSKPGHIGVHLPGTQQFKLAKHFSEVEATLKTLGIFPRLSDGQSIFVKGSDIPPVDRNRWGTQYNIDIHPILLKGKEIGYRFSGKSGLCKQILISAHGSAQSNQAKFRKPYGVEFNFATPTNRLLASSTLEFAEHLQAGRVEFQDPTQTYPTDQDEATNYSLSGNIKTQPQQAAEMIGRMQQSNPRSPFDFVMLNPNAIGIHFADLIQGLQDTFGQDAQTKLVCHFCRPKDSNAKPFVVSNNFI